MAHLGTRERCVEFFFRSFRDGGHLWQHKNPQNQELQKERKDYRMKESQNDLWDWIRNYILKCCLFFEKKEKETLFLYEIKQEITKYKDRLLGSLLFVPHGSSCSNGITLDRAIALDAARNPNPHHWPIRNIFEWHMPKTSAKWQYSKEFHQADQY